MTGQVKKTQKRRKSGHKDRKSGKWLRRFLWFSLTIIALVILVTVLFWVNRYALIEEQARRELQKAGIDAELEFEQVGRSGAIMRNVALSFDGAEFFSADKIIVEYTLEKLRAGIVDKLILSKPQLTLTLDQNGTITDKWFPTSSDNGENTVFPANGVTIENGSVNWQAPFGDGSARIDSEIAAETDWRTKIETTSIQYKSGDIEMDFGFSGELQRTGEDELIVTGLFSTRDLRVRQSRLGGVEADIDVNMTLSEANGKMPLSGKIDMRGSEYLLPAFSTGKSEINLDFSGVYDSENARFDKFRTDWAVQAKDLALTDEDLRTRMVRNTMSYNVLKSAPIAMHFADYFEISGNEFLQDFSFDGQGTYSHSPDGYVVELENDAVLVSGDQTVALKKGAGSEIEYNAVKNQVDLDLNVDWRGKRSLFFRDLTVSGDSDNGLLFQRVRKVASKISSKSAWSGRRAGKNLRLAPFDLQLDYARKDMAGTVEFKGAVDYDGPVPGGYARKLRAGGLLKVDISGNNFSVGYFPASTVGISEFISQTGWRGQAIKFSVANASRVLAKKRSSRPFGVELRQITADIISPENDRHLDADFDKMQISTDLSTTPTVWSLDILGTEMRSEDFPAPGTHIISPTGSARVVQFADGRIEFEIDSPVTRVETENADIRNLSIQMAGVPDDFSANYIAGQVRLKGGDVPVLPMQGTARLAAGELSGFARAQLPESPETPINIEFRSRDGVGSAHIVMPKVVFQPNRLQPQYLIPALKGRIAEVSGETEAEFEFAFSRGGPVSSFGRTVLKNMQIGTLVGPLSGVNAELEFGSIFPPQTRGIQTATLREFDPGIPLENGTVKFEIVPDGVRIHEAFWPVNSAQSGPGRIYIEPMLWRLGNVENRAVVVVDNLSLGDVIAGMGNKNLSATGQISGTLPVSVNGVDVRVNKGVLAVKDGGVIRYKNQGIDTFVPETEGSPVADQLEGIETGFAFKALENFQYRELEAKIDGPLDGEMSLRMAFDGKNDEVLSGTLFRFNISVAGELANIARSTARAFSSQQHIERLRELRNENNEPER